ncbi:MAG: class I SAM-dependent methyltransferase [Candidatus Pacearchaeota archaeon]|jgi:cyclopropane fatty-acyl-phospholipid synthase-like methyltransferase
MSLSLEIIDDYLIRYLVYFNYKNYADRISLQGNEQVLEVGSGGGNLSRFLAEKLPFGKLVCIDNSEYWIEKAERRLRNYENINFRCKDILDFKGERCFDVAVVHYVLHDIKKEERGKVINVLNNNLKKEGRIYIREPIRKSHGIASEEVKDLMLENSFLEEYSKEGYSFPIRGKIYEGVFKNTKS